MPARTRLELIPLLDGSNPHDGGAVRAWTLRVDGEDAGEVSGARSEDEVALDCTVDPRFADRGVERGAIGRLLGLAPWGTDVHYAWQTTDAELARALGFVRDEGDPRRWTRPAPLPRGRAEDITRFLTRDGRIDRYPQRGEVRRELLAWVLERAVPRDAVFTEAQIGDLLEAFAPGGDTAVLRRYLVDAGLLERTRSGSAYARPASPHP